MSIAETRRQPFAKSHDAGKRDANVLAGRRFQGARELLIAPTVLPLIAALEARGRVATAS